MIQSPLDSGGFLYIINPIKDNSIIVKGNFTVEVEVMLGFL
jgi:hypothetical protein